MILVSKHKRACHICGADDHIFMESHETNNEVYCNFCKELVAQGPDGADLWDMHSDDGLQENASSNRSTRRQDIQDIQPEQDDDPEYEDDDDRGSTNEDDQYDDDLDPDDVDANNLTFADQRRLLRIAKVQSEVIDRAFRMLNEHGVSEQDMQRLISGYEHVDLDLEPYRSPLFPYDDMRI